MDEDVRRELDSLRYDLRFLDTTGTRGVGILQSQLNEAIKDINEIRHDVSDHMSSHSDEKRDRIVGRRWLIATMIAFLAVIESPLLYLIVHMR